MERGKVFHVGVIADLDEREWRVLAAATRLTTGRARSYLFEPVSNVTSDIYLIDGNDANSLQSWQSMAVWRPAPAILLKTNPDADVKKREFSRQLVPACLLKLVTLLDQISIEELRFLPELTIGKEEPSTATSPAITATDSTVMHSPYSALVVDDSSTVRAQVGLGLKIFGAQADFAESAEQAFELLGKRSYDIAFLDVVLPGADGYQVCKSIKKGLKHKHTAVIMLTSKSSAFDRVKASLAGCDSYLTKPVQNEQFQQVLNKYLVGITGIDIRQPLTR